MNKSFCNKINAEIYKIKLPKIRILYFNYSLGYGKTIIKIDNNKLIDIIKLKMILQIKL